MSGHSKWSTIKRQKGAADAKRGAIFTKLGNAVAVAARQGADPESNFQLRLAIERARAANMPNENIERAIQRGSGAGGQASEEITYEGFGPGGAAILVQTLTDNRNRTTADLRKIFSDHGGSMAAAGSVSWMFEPRGIIRIERNALGNQSVDDLTLKLIDNGADDISESEDGLTVLSAANELKTVKAAVDELGIPVASAGVELHPKAEASAVDEAMRPKLESLLNALEAHDDVTDYATNAGI